MNLQNLTQKSQQALTQAQQIALENQNMQIEPEHLLYAMLDQEEGLIPRLFTKMGIDVDNALSVIDTAVSKIPGVSGPGREPDKIYVSQAVDGILNTAEKKAKSMKDEYVSVEHIFMAFFEKQTPQIKEIFKSLGVEEHKFLEALQAVRSTNKVVSDNPEATYEALKKYGYDLVERARQQKLDPVIGRDSEIRNVIRILSRKTKNNP
ncbi:MAG: Clp protease N-terminal domain-containing protein, partial [Hydrogenoanaerobacterium sp.]